MCAFTGEYKEIGERKKEEEEEKNTKNCYAHYTRSHYIVCKQSNRLFLRVCVVWFFSRQAEKKKTHTHSLSVAVAVAYEQEWPQIEMFV